jgi:hypothetical protein
MSTLIAKEKLLDKGVSGVFAPSSPSLLERSVQWMTMPLWCRRVGIGNPAKCRSSTPALGGLVLFRSFFVGAPSCDPSIDAKSPPGHS